MKSFSSICIFSSVRFLFQESFHRSSYTWNKTKLGISSSAGLSINILQAGQFESRSGYWICIDFVDNKDPDTLHNSRCTTKITSLKDGQPENRKTECQIGRKTKIWQTRQTKVRQTDRRKSDKQTDENQTSRQTYIRTNRETSNRTNEPTRHTSKIQTNDVPD